MAKFRIIAKSVGLLENEIEANDEEQAEEIMEKMLDNGEMTETDGWIEDKRIEKIWNWKKPTK